MRKTMLITCAVLAICCAGGDDEESLAPLELENGLTVLFEPIRGCGETALVVLYSIGGLHDPKGESGLAHLIEHVYVTVTCGECTRFPCPRLYNLIVHVLHAKPSHDVHFTQSRRLVHIPESGRVALRPFVY